MAMIGDGLHHHPIPPRPSGLVIEQSAQRPQDAANQVNPGPAGSCSVDRIPNAVRALSQPLFLPSHSCEEFRALAGGVFFPASPSRGSCSRCPELCFVSCQVQCQDSHMVRLETSGIVPKPSPGFCSHNIAVSYLNIPVLTPRPNSTTQTLPSKSTQPHFSG